MEDIDIEMVVEDLEDAIERVIIKNYKVALQEMGISPKAFLQTILERLEEDIIDFADRMDEEIRLEAERD